MSPGRRSFDRHARLFPQKAYAGDFLMSLLWSQSPATVLRVFTYENIILRVGKNFKAKKVKNWTVVLAGSAAKTVNVALLCAGYTILSRW